MPSLPPLPTDWETRYREGATGWERPGLNPAFLSWRERGDLTPCRILVPGAGWSVASAGLGGGGFRGHDFGCRSERDRGAEGADPEYLHLPRQTVVHADLFAWEPSSAIRRDL